MAVSTRAELIARYVRGSAGKRWFYVDRRSVVFCSDIVNAAILVPLAQLRRAIAQVDREVAAQRSRRSRRRL
jgi:hypothetical protein